MVREREILNLRYREREKEPNGERERVIRGE